MWQELFVKNQIPMDGEVIEVAPGYEPKIGNALALLKFHGTVFLIEPDPKAAYCIRNAYRQILPSANIRVIIKPLQEVEVGTDIPLRADALVASHPFDDMVMSFMFDQTSFFSEEKACEQNSSAAIKKLYDSALDRDYIYGIQKTAETWKAFVAKSRPAWFIVSQYPSRTLEIKGLTKRQNSGFIVLEILRGVYEKFLKEHDWDQYFGYKGDSKWWIVAQKPRADLAFDLRQRPVAISRLTDSIFVPQRAAKLFPNEYEVVYVDEEYFKNLGYDDIALRAKNFAITLDKHQSHSETVMTYADRQKDKTSISLCGNLGSGRAVYYGNRFNILGVGKTDLCTSLIPSHSTGKAELIGCMRRVILSKWINYFTPRTVAHPALIALKETAIFKWNSNPVPLTILVRIDDGDLDRPNHVEYFPDIPIDFNKTLVEYAKLDAECFAYRIMLGAWSTGNYSLGGRMIDLESASFVKYRGPYYTSSSKYPHNRFGYEGLGLLKILHQLAGAKNIRDNERDNEIESKFYKERRQRLAHCFLYLLGVSRDQAKLFLFKHRESVVSLVVKFEKLAKKISPAKSNLNLYEPICDNEDPALLDMSNFFRNLANIYKSPFAEEGGFDFLARKNALAQARQCAKYEMPDFIKAAVVASGALDKFLRETKDFIRSIFRLLDMLDSEGYLGAKSGWSDRLWEMNRDLPVMFELNGKLKRLSEYYRLGKMNAAALNTEISLLSKI